MHISQLFEQFQIDTNLEAKIRFLLLELDKHYDSRSEEIEAFYSQQREREPTIKQLFRIAREERLLEVDDELAKILTVGQDADLNYGTVIASFADKALFEYLEVNHPDLYHRVQTCPKK
jgi:hypothetical protein